MNTWYCIGVNLNTMTIFSSVYGGSTLRQLYHCSMVVTYLNNQTRLQSYHVRVLLVSLGAIKCRGFKTHGNEEFVPMLPARNPYQSRYHTTQTVFKIQRATRRTDKPTREAITNW